MFGLPDEIVGSIIDYLDIAEICKLSTVSKKYAKIANGTLALEVLITNFFFTKNFFLFNYLFNYL